MVPRPGAFDPKRSAQGLGPVGQSVEGGALRDVGSADAVVLDLDDQSPVGSRHGDGRGVGVRVLGARW
jgi:hypothetical protein